jgi:hypothetical protein
MRQVVVLLALAFVVTLGVVVGTRMSSDAIAVLIGVIAGVAASIPTALLLMAVTRRREPQANASPRHDETRYAGARAAPPVIVVTPGGGVQQHLPPGAAYGYGGPLQGAGFQAPQRRQFRVMGFEEEDDQVVEGETQATAWYQ